MNRSGGLAQSIADATYQLLPVSQTASPTNGQTVNITGTSANIVLWLTPAGTIAGCTVALPADGTTRVGQTITIGSSQIITALTVNGATTIVGALTSLVLNGAFTIRKVAANTWING